MAKNNVSSPGDAVGPGRPPRHSQFEKGKSGNPGGRPRRERDLAKLVDSELDEPVAVTEGGKRIKLTKRQIVAKTLVNEAAKGNLKALDAVIRLVGTSSDTENRFVGVDPGVLASFISRFANQGEQGGDK
jgi:hypothetical protein